MNAPAIGVATQSTKCAEQRSLSGGVCVPIRTDDQQSTAQQLLIQELQERQGGHISPMQVVQHQGNGHLLRCLVEELSDGVKGAKSRRTRIRYRVGRLVGVVR